VKLSYEPAAVAAALAVIFQAVALFGWLPKTFQAEQVADALVLVATALVGLYARSKGWPTAKIEDAATVDPSFHPEAINAKAAKGRRHREAVEERGR